jgi:hypothetical protein
MVAIHYPTAGSAAIAGDRCRRIRSRFPVFIRKAWGRRSVFTIAYHCERQRRRLFPHAADTAEDERMGNAVFPDE